MKFRLVCTITVKKLLLDLRIQSLEFVFQRLNSLLFRLSPNLLRSKFRVIVRANLRGFASDLVHDIVSGKSRQVVYQRMIGATCNAKDKSNAPVQFHDTCSISNEC